MTNEQSSESYPDKMWSIRAVCLNCDKRFTSMRRVSMHLRTTGTCSEFYLPR